MANYCACADFFYSDLISTKFHHQTAHAYKSADFVLFQNPLKPAGKYIGTVYFGTKYFGTKYFSTKYFGTQYIGTEHFGTKYLGNYTFSTMYSGT